MSDRVSGGDGSNVKPPSDTPQADRIERDELSILAREFAATGERWHRSADMFRLAGRATVAVRHAARAWAYDEAARCCLEQLIKSEGGQ